MKRLILFVEDDFVKILKDFKKNVNGNKTDLSDEKAMILLTWFFMEKFNKRAIEKRKKEENKNWFENCYNRSMKN